MTLVSAETVWLALSDAVAVHGQSRIAARAGVPQSVISEVMNGRRGIPASVANALGFIELPKTYRKIAKGVAE